MNSRKKLAKDPTFRSALKNAKDQISKMKIAFVVEEDDITQCLLEVFATVELRARHNSFRTT
jgi:hypothetical protein